jgi:hypothetical protein
LGLRQGQVLDRYILASDISCIPYSLMERVQTDHVAFRRRAIKKPDH